LTSVRRTILRAIFLAEAVFAIFESDLNLEVLAHMTLHEGGGLCPKEHQTSSQKPRHSAGIPAIS
jgi:hypothetical protein